VNLWTAFADETRPGEPLDPGFAATLFWVWAEEPGGLVEDGVGIAWVDDEGELVEPIFDPGSLLFRGGGPLRTAIEDETSEGT